MIDPTVKGGWVDCWVRYALIVGGLALAVPILLLLWITWLCLDWLLEQALALYQKIYAQLYTY